MGLFRCVKSPRYKPYGFLFLFQASHQPGSDLLFCVPGIGLPCQKCFLEGFTCAPLTLCSSLLSIRSFKTIVTWALAWPMGGSSRGLRKDAY